jgi:hypothetical protein
MDKFFWWVHTCSAAMLVGGMTFVFFVLRPGLRRQPDEESLKGVAAFVRTRFRLVCILLTAFIVASGLVNIILSPPKGWYILLLIFKVLLAAGVLGFHFRNAFTKVSHVPLPEPGPSDNRPTEEPASATNRSDWRTTWLLAPSPAQVSTDLALIAGALVVILLGILLVAAH